MALVFMLCLCPVASLPQSLILGADRPIGQAATPGCAAHQAPRRNGHQPRRDLFHKEKDLRLGGVDGLGRVWGEWIPKFVDL